MRSFILPVLTAGLFAVAAAPATAQQYDRERNWFGGPAGFFGEDRRDRFDRDGVERDAFERGYRLGREDEWRRAERARSGHDEDDRRFRRGERADRDWFSGDDGISD